MKQKKIFFFLSAIFMVLMTGGVLEFVGFGMFWLLLFIIVEYIRTKKINKRFVIIFTLSLLGALANAFAPGNFVRHQEFGGKLGIMNAVFLLACCIGVAFLAGNKLFTKDLLPYIKNIKFIVCMTMLLVITLGGDALTNYTPIAISANFQHGFIQKYESDWRSILDQIEHSDELDITIAGAPIEISGCLSPDLTDDPKWWTNGCVACFLRKTVCA